MIRESTAETIPVYENLIGRHVSERCGFLPDDQLERILDGSGLELVSGRVRAKGGRRVTEETAYRYKQAIKAHLGQGAYMMTRVNFRLMGCRCMDCRRESD
jgi:hypothetical protein